MEDKQIIQLLFDRSEDAIDALAQRFGFRLQSIATNLLGSGLDAEECVNDTYLAVWNQIPPATPKPLAPYVYRIGRNIALERQRANSALKRRGNYDLSLDELADCIPDETADQKADAAALSQAINAFLATQSKECRVIFIRRYWFGDSISAIAEDLHLRCGTVSTRLNRIRNALKLYLQKEGIFL